MGARPLSELEEILDAPVGAHLTRPDTRIEQREGWYRLITRSHAIPNEVIRARFAPGEVEADVDRIIREYRALGVPFKWLVGRDSEPADAIARALEARGLESWWARGMAIEPAVIDAAVHGAIEVRRADAEAYGEVVARGWGVDAVIWREDYRRAVATGMQPRLFLAYDGGAAIGAAAYLRKQRAAYFTSAVVLPEHRGRGAYRALVSARLDACAREGLPLVVTQAREATSAPILERLGFRSVCRLRMFAG